MNDRYLSNQQAKHDLVRNFCMNDGCEMYERCPYFYVKSDCIVLPKDIERAFSEDRGDIIEIKQ